METQTEQPKKTYPKKARRFPWPKIDLMKWMMELKEVEGEIRALKKKMRTSGYNPTGKEYSDLSVLKQTATSLYMVRAASHGRIHLKSEALKAQKEQIEDALKDFAAAA